MVYILVSPMLGQGISKDTLQSNVQPVDILLGKYTSDKIK